jgi:two-component system cell cycle sensor histidine kinase/response regulator CckA
MQNDCAKGFSCLYLQRFIVTNTCQQQNFVPPHPSVFHHQRHWLLLRSILPLAVSLLVCETATADLPPASDSARFARPLIVPTVTNSYPSFFVGPSGEYTGFSVELLDAVARVMDIKIHWTPSTGADLQSVLLSGGGDILPGYTRTPGREKYIDFSVPYLELQGTLFVRKDKNSIQKISDLNGRELVVVSKGSVGDQFASDNHLNAHVVYGDSLQQALKELNDGRHDAVFSSRLTALSVIDHFKFDNIRPLGVPVDGYNVTICFAVRKGDSQLLARLNEGLAILQRTGEFARIYNKWFGRFEPTRLTFQELVVYIAATLAVVLLITLWALMRQRQLRQRIGRQAEELIESRAILAEAQQFARIGHWQRPLDPKRTCDLVGGNLPYF